MQVAGHPGSGAGYPRADVQNHVVFMLQELDVRANGRISGVVGCPRVGPDVRAPNPRINSRNSILGRKLGILGSKLTRFRG